jgi:hypothetical protein
MVHGKKRKYSGSTFDFDIMQPAKRRGVERGEYLEGSTSKRNICNSKKKASTPHTNPPRSSRPKGYTTNIVLSGDTSPASDSSAATSPQSLTAPVAGGSTALATFLNAASTTQPTPKRVRTDFDARGPTNDQLNELISGEGYPDGPDFTWEPQGGQ